MEKQNSGLTIDTSLKIPDGILSFECKPKEHGTTETKDKDTDSVSDIKEKESSESPDEQTEESDNKWFSILTSEAICDGVHYTSGNKWDMPGLTMSQKDINTSSELKIPVFPHPNNSFNSSMSCDSPGPLQMTQEESVLLELIKQNGLPEKVELASVPRQYRHGWWRIKDTEQLQNILDKLHARGIREKELKRTIQSTMQVMYETGGKVSIFYYLIVKTSELIYSGHGQPG